MTLIKELTANFESFHTDWTAQAQSNWTTIHPQKSLRESYFRICALNAIKEVLVVPHFSGESVPFFYEAHNDALVSHVNASTGSWRTALQSLRSCIENTLSSIYYRDHPIELALWSEGKFRIGFTELYTYALRHPILSKIDIRITGLDSLKSEYAILSKAVHASATSFRMTDNASSVLLWSTEQPKLGMWSTRERHVVEAICLIIISLHAAGLQGTKQTGLRQILYYAIGSAKRKLLKENLKIVIPTP